MQQHDIQTEYAQPPSDKKELNEQIATELGKKISAFTMELM